MSQPANGRVMFGEWLPDLSPVDNPGMTEALNVLPVNKSYKPYLPLAVYGNALPARPRGGIAAVDTSGNGFFYTGTGTKLYQRSGANWTDKSGATTFTTATDGYWRFVQYDDLVIGTNYTEVPQSIAVGSGGNFAALAITGTAPRARQIGIVGRHLVLGDTVDGTNGTVPHRIQWSRIDDPTEWPTPNTTDARNKQAGEQFLPSALGQVTGIFGNDQAGIILQKFGVTRMTYVGGDLVYEFATIDGTHGCPFPNAAVKVGDWVYFPAADGFYRTNGVTVEPVGAERFDSYFANGVDGSARHRVYGAVDRVRKLIYWLYPGPSSSGGSPRDLIIMNYRDGRAARAVDPIEILVTGLSTATSLEDLDALFPSLEDVAPSLDAQNWRGGNELVQAFDASFRLGTFSGAPGVAVLDGPEVELYPGQHAYVSGVRPIIEGAPSVSIAVGTRNNYADNVSYTPDVSLTPRTGFADMRLEARVMRARVKIAGNFRAAQGVFFAAQPAGAA